MSEEKNKLSPIEYLAKLKAQIAEDQKAPEAPSPAEETVEEIQDIIDSDSPSEDSVDQDLNDIQEEISSDSDPVELASNTIKKEDLPDVIKRNSQLSELFDRVNDLMGGSDQNQEKYYPKVPITLDETNLTAEEIEKLILKFLLNRGSGTGRELSGQVCLPFTLVDPIMKQLKMDQLVAFKGTAEMGDYEFVITDLGRERARRYSDECTYFGAAPVSLPDYLKAMEAQSIAKQEATEEDLKEAFSDLIINEKMLEKLGPAINSGRGMFLFGEPGNGKTSIAERVTKSFGSTIWIPRSIGIEGDIIRLFDPGIHDIVEEDSADGLFDLSGVDQRWVQIVRPTVIAGGELTMEELEVVQNQQTKICEAPLQLKSNCGILVIDDFGRQTMPVDVLLNRWIVPLEKRYDFLNLPSGKKVQVPFDQLIIFSTNLEPKDLVDGAFLRRIPYKIEVIDPSEEEFRALFELMSPIMGFEYNEEAINYLIETHYKKCNRPFRACQPRDLLLQVRNYCIYKGLPKKVSPSAFDFAAEIYFAVM